MDYPEVAHIRARDSLSKYGLSTFATGRAPLPSQSSTFAASSSSGAGIGYRRDGLPSEFASKAQEEWEKRAEKAVIDAEWLIDPKNRGHGPKPEKRVPVFVTTQGTYDEQGRVLESVWSSGKGKGKATDVEVANWFRSLPATAAPSRQPSPPVALTTTVSKPVIMAPTPTPLVIPKSQWFIRRVLLNQHKKSTPIPKAISRPSSIGSLIDTYDDPTILKPQNFGYVLGPSNKGWELLTRNGWEGGGLGPLPPPAPPEVIDMTFSDSDSDSDVEIIEEEKSDVSDVEIIDVKPSIFNLDPSPRPTAALSTPTPVYGPGRTEPISTALKSNRLGIGHSITKKRVTHTPREMKRHVRKSAWASRKQKPEKPKDRERRERVERERIAASLH